MHVGSSSKMPVTRPDAPPAVALTLTFNNAMASLTDWLFSGKLVQYPSLGWRTARARSAGCRTCSNEPTTCGASIGRGPASATRCRNRRARTTTERFGCFFRDRHGIESLIWSGENNVTFETDYPHTDSTWPDTKQIAERMFAGLDDAVVQKIVRGNAIRMLQLDLDA